MPRPVGAFLICPVGPSGSASLGKGTPGIALHDGPGGTSCGFYALDPLADSRRINAYDLRGSACSGRPTEPNLWQVDRFVEEVLILHKKLGLRRVDRIGHSWGASLASARKGPKA